jgi:hypothetical protein
LTAQNLPAHEIVRDELDVITSEVHSPENSLGEETLPEAELKAAEISEESEAEPEEPVVNVVIESVDPVSDRNVPIVKPVVQAEITRPMEAEAPDNPPDSVEETAVSSSNSSSNSISGPFASFTFAMTEDVFVALPLGAWVFLEGPEELRFVKKFNDGDSTVFQFLPVEQGDYLLRFQFQDAGQGIYEERLVSVVMAQDQQEDQVSEDGADVSDSPEQASDTRVEDEPVQLDPIQTVDMSIQRGLKPSTEELLAAQSQALDQQRWTDLERLLLLDDQINSSRDKKQTLLLTRIVLNRSPEADLDTIYEPQFVLEMIHEIHESHPQDALMVLEFYDQWLFDDLYRDYYHYLFGLILQTPGPLQNVKEASRHFGIVEDEFPFSPWWEPSRAALIRLKRLFIEVR